jgi:Flp pilus assembly protein CpaB
MGPIRSARQFFAAAASQAHSAGRTVVNSLEHKRSSQLAFVVITSVMIGLFVAHHALGVRSLRHRWASHVPVLVADRTIRSGDEITADNTRLVDLPQAITAADVLHAVAPGSRAVITLSEHTPITAAMIDSGTARLAVPPGWRGVTLPADLAAPMVSAGDRVDVVAAGSIVAIDALVLSVDADQRIIVAVPTASAATVATAARMGEVSLILSS